ncbi:MAG: NAD(P)/FAD-dependent oxidoreductase [Epsilonproteobacteria bacterium]|nr:MAG: NAD(P)/FAD-dependent oxidoreductase [Campylobacterota bacterium]
MMAKNIAIIGGGASGLLCAIFCAKSGVKVDIYEQNSKCAKKILVSGNGRCNITNTDLSSNDYFSDNPAFVNDALKEFGFKEFEKFCNSIGLMLDVKDDGRVYPLSNEAKSVAKIFEEYALSLDVSFFKDTKIQNIKELQKKYDSVVVATGSQAASHLGGNTDGHEFAKEFGHNIVQTYPSLVQLHLNSKIATKMAGAKLNAEVTLLVNSKKELTTEGDTLFTAYGISGFAILDLSQRVSVGLLEYETLDLSLNLLPNFTAQKLSAHIVKLSQNIPAFSILDILAGLIPLKIANGLLEDINIANSTKNINTKLAKKIANALLNWRFEISDTHGFRHGEVSGGGVDTTEINPKTMESLRCNNLYFCGEVLDVVGRRGGFNFAFAWASAYVAAKNITQQTRD